MPYAFQFEKETAVRIAQLLEQDGDLAAAANVWWQLGAIDPYERLPRERFTELAYVAHNMANRPADVARSRALLRLMSLGLPTARVTRDYFDNLKQLLAARPKRAEPGRVVIGLGSGRCGSTTLAGAMTGVADACATHENPPPLFWDPLEEQLATHVERFRILADYFAIVFDSSHWWLNAVGRMFREFPDARAIGLQRDTDACVRSFMQRKGSGKGSLNHWAVPGNGVWMLSPADPWYPSYAAPGNSADDPDAAKRAMITRYVAEYNQALERTADAYPGRVLLVRTEELSDPATYRAMSDFAGCEVIAPSAALNVGNTADGNQPEFTF